METEITLAQFIRDNGIHMSAERADSNPSNPDWHDADHWRCIIRKGRKQFTVYFSKGYGHHGKEPKASEVLDCLASDASSVENARSFEDWATDLGYDPDSRKAERIYRATERQAKKLRNFLGDEAYETILYHTER